MKIFNTSEYNEKLKIKAININKLKIEHKYFPKTKDELEKIIIQRISDEGYKCSLNDIDTSKITDMSYLFEGSDFNGDISEWNTSNVTDMSYMFYDSIFNNDISNWDVKNVTNMMSMFQLATNFNQDLSNWDVSNVTDMRYMFCCAFNFEHDISKWNTKNVFQHYEIFDHCPLSKQKKKRPVFNK